MSMQSLLTVPNTSDLGKCTLRRTSLWQVSSWGSRGRWAGWGIASSHQVRSVQHCHPSRYPAVCVLNRLCPQEVAGSRVHHHLLALSAKKRATEHLHSRKLMAFHLGQFDSRSLPQRRAGNGHVKAPGLMQRSLQKTELRLFCACQQQCPFSAGPFWSDCSAHRQCQVLNAARVHLFLKLYKKDFNLQTTETFLWAHEGFKQKQQLFRVEHDRIKPSDISEITRASEKHVAASRT